MGLIRKTLSVNFTLGTVGYRSKSEKVARDIRLTANAARRANILLEVQNELISEQTALLESRLAPVVSKPAPVKPKVAPPKVKVAAPPRPPRLKVAKIKEPKPVREPILTQKTMDKAEAMILDSQSADRLELTSALNISDKQADYILSTFEIHGVVSAEDANQERRVLKVRDSE